MPSVGEHVWFECEAKPGPFSDEQLVRLRHDANEWVGFVPSSLIRQDAGRTLVYAIILALANNRLTARIAGNPLQDSLVETNLESAVCD